MYAWVLLRGGRRGGPGRLVRRGDPASRCRAGAKPAYVVLLGAFAWLLHADETVSGLWLLMGLALCLGGDLLLLADSDEAFGFGLVTFLLAHVAFIGAVMTMSRRPPVWVAVAATVAVVAVVVGFVLWPLARRDMAEGLPPMIYAFVLGAFVAVAWWSGQLLVGIGASLFLGSDGLLALGRFWRELGGLPVAVMVTYHLALLLLVFGVLRPDLVAP